jgi:hypothetical protein
MSGNGFPVGRILRLILILSLAPTEACTLATPTDPRPPISTESKENHDLSGVWIGSSITGCTPLRMDGPWRCGARANIMLTFIGEDPAAMAGIYESDRGPAGDAFQESGRIVEERISDSKSFWLRVTMGNHSSCLFNSNLQPEEMGGSYICFRDGTSFERGRWTARRSY